MTEPVQITVDLSGDLLVLWRAIQENQHRTTPDDVGYYDLSTLTGITLSRCHAYVQALRDMGLVEITDGEKRSAFVRKSIRLVKEIPDVG